MTMTGATSTRPTADVGCATLEHRAGPDGDDSGRQYFRGDDDERTYRLKTNKDDRDASSYDDLATLIRTINGTGLPGGDGRFGTDAFRESVDGIMNARAFLRWAGVNLLLGSWDNYYATPSNYYLYNSGRLGAADDFMHAPYFTFIPWDYDNCLGIMTSARSGSTPISRLAQQHRQLTGGTTEGHAYRGEEPPAEQRLPRRRPGLSRIPPGDPVQPGRVRRADRTGLRRRAWGREHQAAYLEIHHALRPAVHRRRVHQRRDLPQRLRAERARHGQEKAEGHRRLRPHAARQRGPATGAARPGTRRATDSASFRTTVEPCAAGVTGKSQEAGR